MERDFYNWNMNEQKRKLLHDSREFYLNLKNGILKPNTWRDDFLELDSYFLERVIINKIPIILAENLK
jgi:hypothetical protein